MAENAEPNRLDHGQTNAVTVSMAPILSMILVSINVSNSILVKLTPNRERCAVLQIGLALNI
jgi:hypothetical protein